MKKIAIIFSLLLFTCSSDDDTSSNNFITSFQLYITNGFVEGDIDEENGEIRFETTGADLNGMTPIIIFSDKATISPSSSQSQNFNNIITYTVTAENGAINSYDVIVDNTPFNTESKILSFSLMIDGVNYDCNINEATKEITLDVVGVDISALSPTISFSESAVISPIPNQVQDFNNSVIYTVTAENGSSSNYTVNITNRPFGTENEILEFSVSDGGQSVSGIIDSNSQNIRLFINNQNIDAISPTITISEYATISPESGVIQDFSSPVEYIVTAENGDTLTYIVSVNPKSINAVNPSFFGHQYYTGTRINVFGNYIDIEQPDAQILLIDGVNEYPMPIVDSEIFSSPGNPTTQIIVIDLPESLPSFANYTLIYRTSEGDIPFNTNLDILQGGPSNMVINQTSFFLNDVLIIDGDNLLSGLVVPSNGNQFIVRNSNNYDIQLNGDATQLTWTMDYQQHFPSYYGDSPQERTIYTIDDNGRVGKPVIATLN